MSKKIGLGLLAVLVLVSLVLVIGGLSSGPSKPATSEDKAQAEQAAQDGEPNSAQAPVVKAEEGLRGEQGGADAANLALPGQLPALKNVQPTTAGVGPAQPHGQLELEGDVQEAEAEAAIQAVFPAIRDCYKELRQRAPQARGRMLMKFAVRPGTEAGQAGLGELFLKETQFTDPTYLTCVRAAIDNTKFPVGRQVQGSVTVPLFLSPQDAGEPAQ